MKSPVSSGKVLSVRPAPLSRRTLLRGAGGAAVALPFIEAMLPPRATAATAPRRLMIMFSANGAVLENMHPKSSGPLGDLPPILKSFTSLRDKLLLVGGLDNTAATKGTGNGHVQGMAGNLTAIENLKNEYAGGISVDQFLAGRLAGKTRFPSLEVGVYGGTGNVRNYISYKGADQPVATESEPGRLFEKLFKGLKVDGAPSAPDPSLARQGRRNQAVVDAIREDARRLESRLAPQDRRILDHHLTSLSEIEKRLVEVSAGGGGPVASGCVPPGAPADVSKSDPQWEPKKGKILLETIAAAFRCDLTRVATFMWTGSGGKALKFLGISRDHHPLAHEHVVSDLTKLETFYADNMARFAQDLDGSAEGTGTVLDNSTVLWTHELATGPLHPRTNYHFVMAGRAGGYFKTGQAVAFNRQRSVNDLLLSLIHGMGFTDVDKFGNPAYVKGPLPLG